MRHFRDFRVFHGQYVTPVNQRNTHQLNHIANTVMTVDDFYTTLGLPEKALLGARIYKKQILENAASSAADRKLISEQIDTLEWRYAIKPATCAIARYDDAEREYGEIAALHIELKTVVPAAQLKRLGDLLQRAIPYPLLLVFVAVSTEQDDVIASPPPPQPLTMPAAMQLAVNMADKRINRADASKLTTLRGFDTGWLNLDGLSQIEQDYLADFKLAACNQQHLYALYADLTRCIVALDIARRTGQYQRSNSTEVDQQRLESLQAMRQLEMQLASQRATLKATTQFNRQLDLNVQIKQLQQQIAAYTVKLISNTREPN